MKKWLKRILLTLILGLGLVAGATWVLLGTQPGFSWLVQTGSAYAPGELQVEQVEGHLLGQLRLSGLTYENQDMLLRMGELKLIWQPGKLWQPVLHINELSSQQIRFEWRKPADDAPSEPLVLDDIKLPLGIRLDQLAVKQVEILPAVDATPIIVDELSLAAAWLKDEIELDQLQLKMPEGSLQGKGKLSPTNNYPLQLTTDIAVTAEEIPHVTLTGSIGGDLQRLEVKQSISGDVAAEISADIADLLEELSWDLKASLTELPAEYLPEDIPSKVLLDISGQGDLKQARADVKLTLPQGEPATGEQPANPVIKLNGSSNFADLSFDLQGDWANLQWPVAGAAQYSSEQGALKLQGSADNYQFTLDGDVAGVDIPPGKLLANGKGDTKHVMLEKFEGDIMQGRLMLVGKVEWQPFVRWDAQIDASEINPGVLAPDWPGKLNLSAKSSGQLQDDKLQLALELEQLAGSLREKALSGSGKFNMLPGKISVKQLVLNSGAAQFTADGELASQWNMSWQLEVPELADLLPYSSGLVSSKGKLLGTAEQPEIDGQLTAEGISYQDMSLQSANGTFALGLNPAQQSRLSLEAVELNVAGQQMANLSLNLDGALQQHNINLSVLHELAELQLAGSGGYNIDKTESWKGALQNLSLKGEKTGDWQLKGPAKLDLSAARLHVEPLCLHEQGSTELCAEADWSAKAPGVAKINLKQFSLEHLSPLLPPQISKLDGMFDVIANVELGDLLKAKLDAKLTPGTLAYTDNKGHDLQVQHHGGMIEAVLDQQQLKAGWKLGMDEHLLAGDLQIPRKELDADPLSAPLSGKIQVDMKDLNLIPAFAPVVESIDGRAQVDLQIKGSIGDPRISGLAKIEASSINMPTAGLDLQNTNISVTGNDGSKLLISGEMNSGGGRLDLNGDLLLDAAQGWPLQLSIKGDGFQAINLPEAQVVVTPDIQLSTVQDVLKVAGSLAVPVALIELKELPEGSESVSTDAVIIENGEVVGGASGYQVDAKVVLELGEKVRFKGFGLKAELGGKLTVNNVPGKLPTAHGELKILSGSYRAYGQDLTIDRGRISYAGGNLDNPSVILRASRRIDDVRVGIDVTGTVKKLEATGFSSDPEMNSDDAIAMLLTGQRSSDPGAARVYAGKELSEDLSVGVNLGGGDEGSEFVVRYRLFNNISVEGTSSSKKSGGRIMYGFEIE